MVHLHELGFNHSPGGSGKANAETFCKSRRLRRSRRNALAEKFDGWFESLALVPEIGPEVSFFFEPGEYGLYVEGFGAKA
jgi:hypothetical protein